MNHDTYEKEMIDGINRHAEEKSQQTIIHSSKVTTAKNGSAKTDFEALKRGLKRTVLALLTAILFGLSVFAFIATATATGYWAVVLFLSAIVLMFWAFVLLYAQGVVRTGRYGGSK